MNVFVSGVSVFPMAHLGRIAICGEGELEGKSVDGFSHVEPTCFPRRRAHEPPGEEPVLRAPPTAFPLFLFFVIVNEPEMIPSFSSHFSNYRRTKNPEGLARWMCR